VLEGLPYGQRSVRRRSSTRWALATAAVAVAAFIVSPVATTASYTIVPGGSAVTVVVSTAGTTSTASFAGTAGQRVSLNFTRVTISSSKISILKPGGTNLLTPFTVTRAGRFLDVRTLPSTGTYKIVVDPRYDYTGRMTLRLYDVPADPTAPIVVGGSPVTVTTTTPGQNATLTFSGTLGQRVSANLTDVNYASGKLRIVSPDLTQLYTPALAFGPAGNFLEPKSLPATGTYTIQVDPQLLATGSATVQLYAVPADPSSPITACTALPCTPTTATTTAPGQNAGLTFSGTAGQRVSVLAGNATYGLPLKLSILKPDATPLFSPAITVGGFDGFVETKTLDVPGTYTISIDPFGADTGSLDVQLYTVPPDLTGAITPGTPLTVTTAMPGQNGLFTFSGTANQRVSVNLTNVTYGSAKVSILKPDLTQLAPPLFVPNTLGDFLEPVKLPVTGTYRVKVDPQGASTGSLDVKLYIVPPDVTGTLTANVTKNVSLPTPGENAVLTYAGTSGQRIFVNLTNVTVGDSECCSAKLKITRPDGSALQTSKTFGTNGTYVDTKALTQNGTYKVWIDPIDEATGALDVTLYLVPADAAATSPALTPNGVSASVTTTVPGQSGKIAFTAAANQRFAYKLNTFGPGFCDVKTTLYDPSGAKIIGTGPTCAPDGNWFDTRTLGGAGTYKILVDPQGLLTGTASLTLYAVPADSVTTLGSSSSVSLTPGQNAFLSFSGTAGQTATVTPQTGGTIGLTRASLVKSDKKTQVGGAQYWDPSFGDPVAAALPAAGTYYLLFDPVGGFSGSSMTFGLSLS
jgi:hypothetical protein